MGITMLPVGFSLWFLKWVFLEIDDNKWTLDGENPGGDPEVIF